MSKKLSARAGITITLSVATLTGCSSFVQQPAPVEAPTRAQTQVYRSADSAPVAPRAEEPVAQATPYQSDAAPRASKAPAPAPVSTAPHPVSADDGKTHVVQPGENLFRIALSHGLKYQVVANWNNLPDTNIKVGQVLRLTPPGADQAGAATGTTATVAPATTASTVKPYPKAVKLAYSDAAVHSIAAQSEGSSKPGVSKNDSSAPGKTAGATASSKKTASETSTGKPASDASAAKAGTEEAVAWSWPVSGKLLRGYSDSNKGMDIGGRMGQSIQAAADGKVVYSGNGLRGYGKLIIIKHNKTFLSAYAHNSQLLVKEGQNVKKGQKIAEMGNTDADQVKLHFEIRRFGKPVDPMQYLNSKP